MFIWTNGMHPGVALIFFVVGLAFVVYMFAHALKQTFGWEDESDPRPRNHHDPDSASHHPSVPPWVCDNSKCQTKNPPHARYCRMCGRPGASRG